MSCFEIPSFFAGVCSPTVLRLKKWMWEVFHFDLEPTVFFLERIQRIGQLILLQDMSRNDLAKKYGITSWFQLWFLCHLIENHYEIAAKAHLSHSWEPLRFFTWRQQQIWCLKALRNEEICQRLSTCGNFSNCCWCSLVFFFFSSFGKIAWFNLDGH